MYKSGKNWLFAGISIVTFSSMLFLGTENVAAATSDQTDSTSTGTESTTSAANALTAQSVALKTSTAATGSTAPASTAVSAATSTAATSTTTSSAVASGTVTSTAASTGTAVSAAAPAVSNSVTLSGASTATAANDSNSTADSTSTAATSATTTATDSVAANTDAEPQDVQQTNTTSSASTTEDTSQTTVVDPASTATLISPTATELEQAKQAALLAYQQTGVTQVLTAAAAESTFNGHTIPDGYTVIYSQDGVIIAVNGVISGGLSDQTTAGIVFVDNRTDVEKVYINSSTSAGTTLYLMASINAATQSGTFSPRNTIPAGTTSFAIGIKDASTPGGKLATYHDFTVDGDGQLVDGDGKPAITEPTVVAAEVSVTANQAGSFTYTVNGGATQNGTYGTALTGINVGDVVVVTPGIVSGYTVTQSNSSFTANADATKNTDVVEYWAVQESIQVNYQDYFGNTIKPSTTTTGSYGNAALNLTTDGSAVDGYTFNADDAINDPAKAVSLILDANGNVVATDATGATITAITLYYKTNITVNVSGTKVYDGLDSANEVNDYKNLTFTDANGEIIPVDVSGMATGNFYYNADVGVYTDGINLNPNLLTTKNPGYQISGVTSKGYTVTAAKTTATISKDGSKTYDGNAISYLPDVTFSDISGAMVAPDIAAWTVADFEYVDAAGNVFTAPTNAGSYTIQFTTAGQAKLDAETNYQITVAPGSYEIKKAAITVTAKDTSKLLGDADPTLTATSAELVDGDQLTYSISRVTGESAGTYTITATAAATDNPDYDITFKTGTFTIQGATASVTISSGHKTYDGKNIDFLPSVNIVRTDNGTALPKIDWVADDFEYVLNDEVTTDTKNVDTYTIRLSVNGQAELAALTDYIFATTQPGEYTIDQAAVTITVTPNQSKVFNTADPTSYASTVSATVDNETLAYEVTREAGENVDDYAYIVKLDNSDINKNYAITVINSLFKITPAAGEVTLNGGFKDYDGQPVPTLTIESPVVVNLVQGDDYTITPEPGTATATLKDAGTYTYTLTQAGIDKIDLVNRNYTLNNYSKSATYTINKKAVTLTANNTGKNFGITKDPTLSATARAGDVVAGETLDYTISRVAGEKVGTYTITATATAGKNSNYDITTKTGTFTISPVK